MKIIGHRGAAGLALENSLESLQTAIEVGVDAVEFDLWLTKDKQLVVSHDMTTGRLSSSDISIPENSLKDILAVKLQNGKPMLTFQQAMKAAGKTPVVIDAKGEGWARPLADALKQTRTEAVTVIALNHNELLKFNKLRPKLPVYAMDFYNPIKILRTARRGKLTGIDMSFWFLNPITYGLARSWGLDVIIFTVDKLWFAKFLRLLYPKISITTNRPDKLQTLRHI